MQIEYYLLGKIIVNIIVIVKYLSWVEEIAIVLNDSITLQSIRASIIEQSNVYIYLVYMLLLHLYLILRYFVCLHQIETIIVSDQFNVPRRHRTVTYLWICHN